VYSSQDEINSRFLRPEYFLKDMIFIPFTAMQHRSIAKLKVNLVVHLRDIMFCL
jgi:hypothetical protein